MNHAINYGMILLYLFLGLSLMISFLVSVTAKHGLPLFLGSIVNFAAILTLLAWSHGWHLTWAVQ